MIIEAMVYLISPGLAVFFIYINSTDGYVVAYAWSGGLLSDPEYFAWGPM